MTAPEQTRAVGGGRHDLQLGTAGDAYTEAVPGAKIEEAERGDACEHDLPLLA